MTDSSIKRCPLKGVSENFFASLRSFMENLATKVEKLMFTRAEISAEESFLRNFDFLTKY